MTKNKDNIFLFIFVFLTCHSFFFPRTINVAKRSGMSSCNLTYCKFCTNSFLSTVYFRQNNITYPSLFLKTWFYRFCIDDRKFLVCATKPTTNGAFTPSKNINIQSGKITCKVYGWGRQRGVKVSLCAFCTSSLRSTAGVSNTSFASYQ